MTTAGSAKWNIDPYTSGEAVARPVGFDATLLHFYETQSPDGAPLEIYCYTNDFSYAPGDEVALRTSTSGTTWALEIQRDGAHPETVYRADDLEGTRHETPPDCAERGCGWPVSHTFRIPDDWPSGFYRIFVTASRDGEAQRHEHFFVVRPQGAARRNRRLFVHSTATWTAYNAWGGSCHYGGITGPDGDLPSPRLSIERPFERGFFWLPVGAPRIPLRLPTPPGGAVHYPNLDYAYAKGFGKFYAAAAYAIFQRPFLIWAEQNGFDFDQITQHDLHFRPELLEDYDSVVISGHDEYWSRPMREAIDRFAEAGGGVARFGGNFAWQIRLEDDGATQVCHWGANDPVENTEDHALLSGAWEDARIAWPGATTFGLNAFRGIYHRLPGAAPRGSGGFTVYRPEHWAFEGTDLYYGDVIGAGSQIAGYEVDGVDYTFRDGLPFPTGVDGAPDDLEILAMVPATPGAEERSHDGNVYFVGHADFLASAEVLLGEATPEAVERTRRGSGMVASFVRGKGEVFNAAACEWVVGLIDRDVFVERITKNALERFSKQS